MDADHALFLAHANQLEQAAARCEKAVYAEEIEVQKYIQSVLFDKKVALMVEIEEGEQK